MADYVFYPFLVKEFTTLNDLRSALNLPFQLKDMVTMSGIGPESVGAAFYQWFLQRMSWAE